MKSNVTSMFSKFVANIGSIFSFGQYAKAATSPYVAADFAGIDTYDYPSQCMDADPLTMTPINSTNMQTILASKGIIVADTEMKWDLVTDSDAFYEYIYSKLKNESDPDSIAVQIYNCALLDNDVRGGLGALYGYTDDHGLETQTSDDSTSGTGDCEGLALGAGQSHNGQTEKGVATNYTRYQLPDSPNYNKYAATADQWGRKELVSTIYSVAKRWNNAHPDLKLQIGDLDATSGHASHRNGVDVDFGGCPFFMTCANYDINASIELGKMLIDAGNIQYIFYNDPIVQAAVNAYAIKNNLTNGVSNQMQSWPDHKDHFHVRIMAGMNPKGCE
jgi:hypothetical protein